jgi:hypothetical protein
MGKSFMHHDDLAQRRILRDGRLARSSADIPEQWKERDEKRVFSSFSLFLAGTFYIEACEHYHLPVIFENSHNRRRDIHDSGSRFPFEREWGKTRKPLPLYSSATVFLIPP